MPASTRGRRLLLCYLAVVIAAVFGYALVAIPGKNYSTAAYAPLTNFLPIRVWGGIYLALASFALSALIGRVYKVAFYGFAVLAGIEMAFGLLLTDGAITAAGARGLLGGFVYVSLSLYAALAAMAAWDLA